MKFIFCLAAILAAVICEGFAQAAVLRKLHRHYNTKTGDHFYTVDHSPQYSAQLATMNYKYEGFVGRILSSQQTGTIPLHRYFNGKDHFYTTNFAELGGGRGKYVYERIEGYVFPRRVLGLKPLYRYYNSKVGDHFYTPNWAELQGGKNGYVFEKVEAYIFP